MDDGDAHSANDVQQLEGDRMDKYGQVGPDKPGYDDDARSIAYGLTQGPVHVKLAYRMTQYRLLLVRMDHVDVVGGDTGLGLGGDSLAGWLYVAADGKGAAPVRIGDYLEAGYVQEKLGLQTVVCGDTVASFLTKVAQHVRSFA